MANNLLINSKSLYLLQHAHNPVNWYPWSEEAFKIAQRQNKPVLLSIGYSACHWCHVMAHESFEDEETAKLMNSLFINIKVDKEERPDLDQIYQLCLQFLTRQPGGWPLTLFLSPHDKIPYWGGTYFPNTPKYHLQSFKEILKKVSYYYAENHAQITAQNKRLKEALDGLSTSYTKKNTMFNDNVISQATTLIVDEYDPIYGGFGHAPKFPPHQYLQFLTDEKKINFTLEKMANGGIMDQIGGGFFRYAVDHQWEIPHFEKMLYDNAQLLIIYTHAGNEYISTLIAEWLMREMESPNGGYYASLDADIEGQEGKYYYWDREEIVQLLTPKEFDIAARYYNLNDPPNFEGHWHLHKKTTDTIPEKIRQKLLKARQARPYPACNKKIIMSWNGLAIKGMISAGKKFNNSAFIQSAERAIQYCCANLSQENMFLDDYAFLLYGVIERLDKYIDFAIKLADIICDNFYDKDNGGFFFTSHTHESLITRLKPLVDNVTPSGNGIAILSLIKLGQLLNNKHYLAIAKKSLTLAWPYIEKNPHFYTTLLNALTAYLRATSKTDTITS